MPAAPLPDRPSKDQLLRGDAATVKSWMQDAITGYLRGEGAAALIPFESAFQRDDLLAGDLDTIYRKVPASNQRAWRIAVADLVAELPAFQANGGIFDTLIDLARLMPAYEVFARAGARLRSRNFGELKALNGQSLFERVLGLAIELATQTSVMCELLVDLASSDLLRPSQAGVTLTALCASAPGEWTHYLEYMRPKMAEMMLVERPSAKGLHRHAQRLLSVVGARRLTLGLGRLKLAPEDASPSERAQSDSWLYDALFLGETPLLKVTPSEGVFGIIEAGKPSTSFNVPKVMLQTIVVTTRNALIKEPSRRGRGPVPGPFDLDDPATWLVMAHDLERRGFLVEQDT